MGHTFSTQTRTLRRCVLALTCFACFTPGLAAGVTTNISADVWGAARDSGRDGSFESISFPDAIVVQNIPNANLVDRGVFEFDLSELPPLGTILSIELQIVLASTTLGDTNFDVFQYAGDGAISAGDVLLGSYLATSVSNGQLPSTDVMSFVLNPATLAAGYAGFNLRLLAEGSGTVIQKTFQTPDSGFGTSSPWLVVEHSVPAPSSGALLGLGLALFAGTGRHRRQA